MTYRVYPTDVVNEPFADDRGFPGNRNYIDTLAGYSGIRAPTQQEFNAIFYSLDRGYRDGLFGEVDINSRSYTVHTFVFDGGSTTSISDGSLAFNAGANAIAAGAPANSIWTGFNANYLTPESSFGDLVLYGSHEVNHSSINIDRRSSQILNDIPNDLLANIAAKLGLSLDRARAAVLAAIEHKLIGERTEGYNGLSDNASKVYLGTSLVDAGGFGRTGGPFTSLSIDEFKDSAALVAAMLDEYLPSSCFPAHAPIQTSLSTTTPISALLLGDIVLAFDPAADLGRGALVPRRITRLYRNTTTEWIKLTWAENGEPKELITTPGHHFLNDLGQFPTIAAMLRDGQTTVVLANGSLAQVTATRISYAADTAHLFDRALSFAAQGNAAAQAVELDCWQTYNLEVEDLHTYVAGGVRVHNESGFLGRVGNAIDTGIDGAFGFTEGSFGDVFTDVLTAPFHIVGEILTSIFPGGYEDKGGIRGTGLTLVDFGDDGDRSNDFFVDQFGNKYLTTGDALDRSPAQEQQATDNLAVWQGFLGLGDGSSVGGNATAVQGAGGAGGDSGPPSSTNDNHEGPKGQQNSNSSHVNIWTDHGVNTGPKVITTGGIKNLATTPILLDLDGNGIQITELDRSTTFMDASGSGLRHRTAWAGAGDGVLFYDADGSGTINDDREYVFTAWDKTAGDDLTALRSRFDTNGDGKLSGAELTGFKVMVAGANGALTDQTLAALGITELRLTPDTTRVALADGSAITGQATFVIGGVLQPFGSKKDVPRRPEINFSLEPIKPIAINAMKHCRRALM